MNIDKFKKEDGYYDEEGCFFEDAEDFIMTGILGFCGCGAPEESLKYVHDSLKLVHDLQHEVWENKITYKDWASNKDEFFKSTGAEYFMWYYLDNKRLTEHGGSVPGWLTDKGRELLEDLNELSLNSDED